MQAPSLRRQQPAVTRRTRRNKLYSWNSMGPTPTPTQTRTLGMRLSFNVVNVYAIAYRVQDRVQDTFTLVHARIPNGHPREEKRACRTSRRGSSCVSGSWQAEWGSRRIRRLPPQFGARILARKSARMSVSVSWNSSLS